MYRDYENPATLNARLESAKASLTRAIRTGEDIEVIAGLNNTVEDLKERINFAYQDEEE